MSEFWYTTGTMKDVYGSDHVAFRLFDSTHIFWLVFFVVSTISLAMIYRRSTTSTRRKILIVLTVLLVLDELVKYAFMIPTNQFEYSYLPLHVCSINIFVCLWNTIHPNPLAKNILYAMCLPGALVALLSPTWTSLPIFNIMHLHSETVHIMLFMYPVLLLTEGFKPDYKLLPQVFGCLCIEAVVALFFNTKFGTNFLFISGNENNPILLMVENVFGNFYVVGLAILVCIVWFFLYLPWIIRQIKEKKVYSVK